MWWRGGLPGVGSIVLSTEQKDARKNCWMIRSTNQILTTHVGSLPRPDDLIQITSCSPRRRDSRGPERARKCNEIDCRRNRLEADSGRYQRIFSVNDGEMSKPSYATYIETASPVLAAKAMASSIRMSPNSPKWPNGYSMIPAGRAERRRVAMRKYQSATAALCSRTQKTLQQLSVVLM